MERARQDARESLELLRGYDGNGGFVPHLRGYLNQLHQDSKLVFDLDASDNPPLETPVQVQLLRICQEALTNVRKHSGAYRVEVKVKPVDGHLKVSIADDGCGFDALTYYHDGGRARGHGLAVMQERAESVGGRVRVLSMPGQGTEVQVEVPTDHHSSRWIWAKR
jgi:signal transduction histidine kinase